jgi:hypothetical protein
MSENGNTNGQVGLPEAPASVNFEAIAPNGAAIVRTLRGADDEVLTERLNRELARLGALGFSFGKTRMPYATLKAYTPQGFDVILNVPGQSVNEVAKNVTALAEYLINHSWTVDPLWAIEKRQQQAGHNGQAAPEAQPGKPLPLAAAGPAPATVPVPAGGGQDLTFEAEKLGAEISQGQARWKVFGGRFSKFGVTIWPEILGETFNVDELDPTQVYQLDNYRATYVNNDKGNPSKVTRLESIG